VHIVATTPDRLLAELQIAVRRHAKHAIIARACEYTYAHAYASIKRLSLQELQTLPYFPKVFSAPCSRFIAAAAAVALPLPPLYFS
jgi:hypothetical protein